jgi:hypothetical protein
MTRDLLTSWLSSLATPLSVLYPPNVVAAAALFIACQQLGEALPEPLPTSATMPLNDESKMNGVESGEEVEQEVWQGPWYELFRAPPEDVRGTFPRRSLSIVIFNCPNRNF